MTTNISEALNSVLKKAKVLLLKALVELIFNKLVKYFHQHREEAENCVYPFPTQNFDKFLRIEMKSREHKVTTYNPREGIYMVKSPIRVSVCRENGSRTDTYVPEIYSRQTYRRTYQVNLHPVLSENFWRDVPFNLTFYPPNMKRNGVGNRASDFRGEWIIKNQILP
ncbi:hypothetical protein M9H77_27670 [Catharanthus roseus]|uniref:Uncharacterized protein n=1 Tax=Catharanthus roseus TaxID=4058 RepID=A0ACC0AFU4_CATRO|nr:hypothetical protein M9H77_27670 [Catharanthus roseus]